MQLYTGLGWSASASAAVQDIDVRDILRLIPDAGS